MNSKAKKQGIEEQSAEEFNFEAGVEELERIVNALEQREVPLETALDLFQEGIKLVKHCSQILDRAEKQMEILLEGPDGKLYVEKASYRVEG